MATVRCLLLFLIGFGEAWMPDPSARLLIKYGEEQSEEFLGNTTAADHFKILDKDDLTVLVGGRNTIYNLSLHDLSENVEQRLVWHPTDYHQELCQLKGKTLDDCQNYPRIAVKVSDSTTMICGTYAYKPHCRNYTRGDTNEESYPVDGTGRSPYDPEHNSTALYTGGNLYTATVADFSGTDALIYKDPLRTERSDLRLLNDPSFVGAVSTNDHVLFFLRETAVEFMNCGKAVYSRVARVCKNDKGGPHGFSDRWTTFLKARLNCSMPGDYPFYFDEIQSSTELINGVYGKGSEKTDIVYAVMNTPQNAIGGSAVCAFSIRDITDAFESPFKSQETINANWLPVDKDKVPDTRPGRCMEDSRTLSDTAMNFIKNHPLVDKAVPSFYARPVLVKVSLQYRFSAIAVHPQAQAMNGHKYDIIYVGTDDGRVIKSVNIAAGEGDFDNTTEEDTKNPVKTVVISENQVLPPGVPIKQMHVVLTTEKLIVSSSDIIKSVSLYHCGKAQTCRDCVTLQDPHCAWDIKVQQCVWVGARQFPNPERFLQSIEHGKGEVCNRLPLSTATENLSPRHHIPKAAKQPETKTKHIQNNDLPNEIVIEVVETNVVEQNDNTIDKHETDSLKINKADNIYSAHALMSAVVASCIITLMVGFAIGYMFSRRFRNPFFADTSPFNEQHNHLNRLSPLETPLNANPAAYIPPRNKNVNMVANSNLKQDNLHHDLGKDRSLDIKNSNESLDKDLKFGTLQKVKKTYI